MKWKNYYRPCIIDQSTFSSVSLIVYGDASRQRDVRIEITDYIEESLRHGWVDNIEESNDTLRRRLKRWRRGTPAKSDWFEVTLLYAAAKAYQMNFALLTEGCEEYRIFSPNFDGTQESNILDPQLDIGGMYLSRSNPTAHPTLGLDHFTVLAFNN